MSDEIAISKLDPVATPLVGDEELAIVQLGVTLKVAVDDLKPPTPVIADSTAIDVPALLIDFNNLLQSLRDAKVIGT